MRKATTLLILALGTLAASSAVAATAWTPGFKPTKVWVGYTDGRVYVEGGANQSACTNAIIEFAPNDGDPAKIMNLAMSALLSGRALSCYVSGCGANNAYQRGSFCEIRPTP